MMPRVIVIVLAAMLAVAAVAQARREPVHTTIGIEGRTIFRHPAGEVVQSVPVDDKAPVVVRIAEATRDGDWMLYDLRFIAQYAGEFDLRQCLRRPDGAALTNAEPLPVVVGKLLPDDHQGALFELGGVRVPRLGGYRLALLVIGIVWLAVPVWFIARRLLRKRPPAPPPPDAPVTLADQLRPLVESALRGELSTGDRARLEMLLLGYWRERLGLGGVEHAAAVRTMRAHAEAGELLEQLERWLHRPRRADEPAVDVSAMLMRYRDARPVQIPTHGQPVGGGA